jgi:Raf kinase inhibitor-like YbhB/YbcL family protein
MRLTSPSFSDGHPIPPKYGRNVGNISPPLDIQDVPAGTASLVLLMTDPDIPEAAKIKFNIQEWDHWIVLDISPNTLHIPEGKNPEGVFGVNTRGNNHYDGPAPPDREHRYVFDLYALKSKLGLETGCTKERIKQKMNGQILGHASLMGTFKP